MKAVHLTALLLIMTTLIACSIQSPTPEEQEGIPEGLAAVEFESVLPEEEKQLTVWAPGTVKSFVYRAIPSFAQDDDLQNEIIGNCPDWRPVKFFDNDGMENTVGHLKASMGYYQPGGWTIEIKALNSGGNAVYYGSTGQVYLHAGEKNGFIVPLHGVPGMGGAASLAVEFTGPRSAENLADNPKPLLVLEYLDGTRLVLDKGWKSVLNADGGTITHSILKESVPAGEANAHLSLVMPNGTKITEEHLSILFVSGERSTIDGTLETGEYIGPQFDIHTDRDRIYAEISAISGAVADGPLSNGAPSGVFRMKKASASTASADFACNVTGKAADSIEWYLDGMKIAEGANCTVPFDKGSPSGESTLAAIIHRGDMLTTVDVIVVREEVL